MVPNPTRFLAEHPAGDFVMTAAQKKAEAERLLASPTSFVIVDQRWYARPGLPDPLLTALRDAFHPVRGYGTVLLLERGNDPGWLAFAERLRRALITGPTPADVAPSRAVADAHPDEPVAWRMLGLALQASGDAPGAIDALHRAAALDPQDALPLETTAAMLARSNRKSEAIHDLRRARAVRGSDALDKLAAQLGVAPE